MGPYAIERVRANGAFGHTVSDHCGKTLEEKSAVAGTPSQELRELRPRNRAKLAWRS